MDCQANNMQIVPVKMQFHAAPAGALPLILCRPVQAFFQVDFFQSLLAVESEPQAFPSYIIEFVAGSIQCVHPLPPIQQALHIRFGSVMPFGSALACSS